MEFEIRSQGDFVGGFCTICSISSLIMYLDDHSISKVHCWKLQVWDGLLAHLTRYALYNLSSKIESSSLSTALQWVA